MIPAVQQVDAVEVCAHYLDARELTTGDRGTELKRGAIRDRLATHDARSKVWRRAAFSTLPIALRGSLATTTTVFGTW